MYQLMAIPGIAVNRSMEAIKEIPKLNPSNNDLSFGYPSPLNHQHKLYLRF